jgi:hypothetical protein
VFFPYVSAVTRDLDGLAVHHARKGADMHRAAALAVIGKRLIVDVADTA